MGRTGNCLDHSARVVKDLGHMVRQSPAKPSTDATQPTKMKPLGILGGGQLARMLALKCHELGVPVAVYSSKKDDPAAQVVSNWTEASFDDERALADFLRRSSVVTFESEFMDAERLAKLEAKTRTPILPSPRLMGALQDRLTQKTMLEHHRLPTAPFHDVKDEQAAQNAFDEFKGGAVFKKRLFGYDGYGTFIVRSQDELDEFLINEFDSDAGFIAEAFVPFKRELAFVCARSNSKDIARFPFVETYQENSRCLWVKGPIKPAPKLEKLGRRVEAFLSEIGYVGVMGIELFETKDGSFVINELAPRVHNSAHYSLDALDFDQFSAHILAVLGAPLKTPKALSPGFAMMNLLGQGSQSPNWKWPVGVHLHWYGKSENRSGRKMGHYNVLAPTPAKALQKALQARAHFDV